MKIIKWLWVRVWWLFTGRKSANFINVDFKTLYGKNGVSYNGNIRSVYKNCRFSEESYSLPDEEVWMESYLPCDDKPSPWGNHKGIEVYIENSKGSATISIPIKKTEPKLIISDEPGPGEKWYGKTTKY